MIRHEGAEWVLYSSDGGKVLGRFASREKALVRERQILYFKHAREAGMMPGGAAAAMGGRKLRVLLFDKSTYPDERSVETWCRANGHACGGVSDLGDMWEVYQWAPQNAQEMYGGEPMVPMGSGVTGVMEQSPMPAVTRGAHSRALEAEPTDLTGMEWVVTVIRAGESLNGAIYPEPVLRDALPLFDGCPVGAYTWTDPKTGQLAWGHLPDQLWAQTGGTGLLRNVVGALHEPRLEGGAVRATMRLLPGEEWLGRKLLEMRRAVGAEAFSRNFGLSVDVHRDGHPTVTRISWVTSVDLVNGPAAGGELLRAVASHLRRTEPMWDFILKLLAARDPALAERVRASGVDSMESLLAKDRGLYDEVMRVAVPPTAEEKAAADAKAAEDKAAADKVVEDKAAADKLAADAKVAEDKAAADAKAGNNGKGADKPSADVAAADQRAAAALKSVEALEQRLRDRDLQSIVSGAKLPEKLGSVVLGQFAGRGWRETDVLSTIRTIQAGLADHARVGQDTLLDGRAFESVNIVDDERDKRVMGAAAMLLGGSRPVYGYREKHRILIGRRAAEQSVLRVTLDPVVAQAHGGRIYPPYNGIQHFYLDQVGEWDPGVTGQIQQRRAKETVDTATWTEVLRDAFHVVGAMFYQDANWSLPWQRLATIVTVNDFKNQYMAGLGGYADMPAVPEGDDFPPLTTPADFETYYAVGQYGGTEAVTLQAIRNDQTGKVAAIPRQIGRMAARKVCKVAMDLLRTNPAWTGDAVALFHSNHANTSATALSTAANLWVLCALIIEQTELTNSERLGLIPEFLLINTGRLDEASQILQAEMDIDGTNSITPNRIKGALRTMGRTKEIGLEILLVPYWLSTDTYKWVVAAGPSQLNGMEIGFLDGKTEPTIEVVEAPTGSNFLPRNNTVLYKAQHIFGAVIRDYRAFAGSTTQ